LSQERRDESQKGKVGEGKQRNARSGITGTELVLHKRLWYNPSMLPFDNILDAVHGLSYEEKLKLRLHLDLEISSPKGSPSCSKGDNERAAKIVGLFADEPELMDRVLEAVYERRSRPLRLNS